MIDESKKTLLERINELENKLDPTNGGKKVSMHEFKSRLNAELNRVFNEYKEAPDKETKDRLTTELAELITHYMGKWIENEERNKNYAVPAEVLKIIYEKLDEKESNEVQEVYKKLGDDGKNFVRMILSEGKSKDPLIIGMALKIVSFNILIDNDYYTYLKNFLSNIGGIIENNSLEEKTNILKLVKNRLNDPNIKLKFKLDNYTKLPNELQEELKENDETTKGDTVKGLIKNITDLVKIVSSNLIDSAQLYDKLIGTADGKKKNLQETNEQRLKLIIEGLEILEILLTTPEFLTAFDKKEQINPIITLHDAIKNKETLRERYTSFLRKVFKNLLDLKPSKLFVEDKKEARYLRKQWIHQIKKARFMILKELSKIPEVVNNGEISKREIFKKLPLGLKLYFILKQISGVFHKQELYTNSNNPPSTTTEGGTTEQYT